VPFYNFNKALILIFKDIILRRLIKFTFTLSNFILYIALLYLIFLKVKLLKLPYKLARLILK
jgi:hypothetical protein